MEIDVRIYTVLPVQSGVSQQGNNWMRQGFVAETEGNYPKKIAFNVIGEDKIKRFGVENLKPSEHKRVYFHIDAREYQGRWYNEVIVDDIRETAAAVAADPSKAI